MMNRALMPQSDEYGLYFENQYFQKVPAVVVSAAAVVAAAAAADPMSKHSLCSATTENKINHAIEYSCSKKHNQL